MVSQDPNDPNFGLETDTSNPNFGLPVEAPKEEGGVLSGIAAGIGRALNPINLIKGALDIGGESDISKIRRYSTALGEIVSGTPQRQALEENIPEVAQQQKAVFGEYGGREQAAALTGIGLQAGLVALPFVHGRLSEIAFGKPPPVAETPVTDTVAPVAPEVHKTSETTITDAVKPIAPEEVIPNASEITGPEGLPVQPLREEMGGETPLRQPGEITGAQEEAAAAAPQETVAPETPPVPEAATEVQAPVPETPVEPQPPAAAAPETTLYRGGGEGAPPKGQTAADIVDYETKELGNTITPTEGIDLKSVPAEDTQWLSPTEVAAAQFGEVEPVTGNFRVLATDPDGGVLVERQKPPPPPEAPVSEAAPPVVPEATSGVSIPVMITKQMEADLKTQGFSQEEINKMTPQEAHENLQPTPTSEAPKAEVQPTPAKPPPIPVEYSGTDNPAVSRFANRFSQERVASGEIGEIAPGQGYSTQDLVQRGLSMPPEKVADSVSRVMQGADVPVEDAAAIRGEEARLSQRSANLSKISDADPNNVEAKVAADNAFKDLTDFHNGPVATLKNNWANQGRAMQGEIPVDLSSFNGMREAWLRDTGEAPPVSMEPKLRAMADKVSTSMSDENGAMTKLGQQIDQVTSKRTLPNADDVVNNIMERMKNNPCRT